MNVKGLIVSSSKEDYKTYDCEISVPALKIHMDEKAADLVRENMPKSIYTSVLFMIEGFPVEVSVYKRDEISLYANAKEISQLNLDRTPILKQNTLVQKHLGLDVAPVKRNTTASNYKTTKPKKF